MTDVKEKSSVRSFGGVQKVFTHQSDACKCEMTFAVYLPETSKPCPVLYYLSGLTCTHENVVTKGGFQKYANDKGIIIVCPDTSPRGVKVEGDDDGWDFGTGAGFYVDATEDKWKTNYNMYSYITSELIDVVEENFNTVKDVQSICGHSMGGHGAMICAMKNPGLYKSVSAFSPICHPSACPWGVKAFTGYLGEDKSTWADYDATLLAAKYDGPPLNMLVDIGKGDSFYTGKQLLPEDLTEACLKAQIPLAVRMHADYDHSYYFISSFMEDHINHHAQAFTEQKQ